jgi:hypothetical protein
MAALVQALVQELEADNPLRPRSIEQQLAAGMQAFAEGRDFLPWVEAAVATARRVMGELEAVGDASPEARRRAFRALRDIERGLLETSALRDLLDACAPDAGARGAAGLDEALARLHEWICRREEVGLPAAAVPHLTLRLRRLRALLHLLDVRGGAEAAGAPGGGAGTGAAAAWRPRLSRAFRLLLGRVQADPPSPLRRITCAALARAGDALVRDDPGELSDVLIAILTRVRSVDDLRALGEASIVGELADVLQAAAELAHLTAAPQRRPDEPSFLDAFAELGRTLPLAVSPRVEGLRRALGQIERALRDIDAAPTLGALRQTGEAPALQRLEEAVFYAARLALAARRRMGLAVGPDAEPAVGRALRALEVAVDQTATLDPLGSDFDEAVQAARAALAADLPAVIGDPIRRALGRLPHLPRDGARTSGPPALAGGGAGAAATADPRLRLPAWLPPSRIVGGFHVLRPIGSGAAGSVFVARRADGRHDEAAETYALKFPSYDGQNARTLTEQEFLQIFREEAGALLTLPANPNLAQFVTFDAGARPKPILVMELVRGPSLERLLDKRELSAPVAFHVMDGIAAGLGAMHAMGLAHLDVKPANVILRAPHGGSDSRLQRLDALMPTPVLVDFGLAGRKIRPGCASPYYGAPEVWDATAFPGSDPTAADVYGFCCLGYELVTGRTLFHADTLPALIGSHFAHQGSPGGLAPLFADARLAPLAQVLSSGLAPDPRHRATIDEVRAALDGVAAALEGETAWPLAA